MTLFRCILCPTDFSAPAAVALEHAARLAASCGARLWLLHVIPTDVYPLPEIASLPGFPDLRAELRKTAEADLQEQRRRVPAGVPVDVALREGVPYEEILAVAAEVGCDLLVMATNGRTGWRHALLGSVAERIVRLAPCPVLTVRVPAKPEAR
jgi:nucleotide-binding universal stress UspA family protein